MLSQSTLKAYWAPRCSGPFATVSLNGAGKVVVDAAIVPAVKALDKVLIAYGYLTRAADTGAFNCRLTASGTWSLHAYGIALDVNWQTNPYLRYLRSDMDDIGDHRMPNRICEIRTNNGKQVWNWGGFWSGNKDSMHYEIVCTPADLRTGINPATINGGTLSVPTPSVPTPKPEEANLVYRIHWFTGEPTAPGDQPNITAAYRTLSALCENTGAYLVVSAWWIQDPEALTVWRARGLKEISPPATYLRGSIEFFGGPFDNTKTF